MNYFQIYVRVLSEVVGGASFFILNAGMNGGSMNYEAMHAITLLNTKNSDSE